MENKIEEFKKYLMNLERSASTIESYILAVRFFSSDMRNSARRI